MGLTLMGRIGRKYAIYLPRRIVEELKVREGDRIRISTEGDRIIIDIVRDPLHLALHGRKFARISDDEIERISLEEQRRYEGSP